MHEIPNTLFQDVPPDEFPFGIEMINCETGEILWTQIVTGPGVVTIPSKTELGTEDGIDVRLTYPGGKWVMASYKTGGGITSGDS